MSPFKVCFLGTPDFAAKHLRALLENSNYEVVGVVTQPDRPAGRKMQLTPSPVKVLAQEKEIETLTPESLRNDPQSLEKIRSWGAETAIVVAFGQILSQEFLDSFKFGAVNIHGSLLPRWRGAAPIQRSLEAGDTETGVTLQRIVRKLDAGPIIGERRISLDEQVNATELYEKLSVLGCELLNAELLRYLKNEIVPREQDEKLVTIAKKIEKEESLINWGESARKIHNRVRAFSMGPGTYVMFQGKRLKLHRTAVVAGANGAPGQVLSQTPEGVTVQTGNDALLLKEVQPESKSKMPAFEFVKNLNIKKGELFV